MPASAERAIYLDSSAIVKLVVNEPQSAALRAYLQRRRTLVSSAVARTEVTRAVLPEGASAVARASEVLSRIRLLRLSNRLLIAAGGLAPPELRSLDAIHLASAQVLGRDLARIVMYDDRMSVAATDMGWEVVSPS